ncbi:MULTISPECIES: hypothetical protein [Methanosarcina]|uniref:Uncharacterized protein n=2 Tax=Methanosarcina barkeri TaxID=2208 RepID=A0A0E3LNR6_METBA|nr:MULTISPECIES: hypothetical protein [Methanosarcina]AKB55236.1 hypothetical protein MSBRM_2238 [Methanosarcina barkeri MS]AKB56687.1 hypothetical protein MSBR2_0171 [Methanosarcina barkeri 227]OEC89372.1 hypothetical protein A9239_05755 [Methanosarcina sp. A14]
MGSKIYILIEKKKRILFQLTLSLILLFALMSPAIADKDPEETAGPQNPVQVVGPVSDYGLDLDGDGLYDYLVVKFNAQSDAPSTYFFTGDLSVDLGYHESKGSTVHEFRAINLAKNSTYLDGNTSKVLLNFEGGRIRENELNGPYQVEISLSNGSWGFGRGLKYTTEAYEFVKFEQPELLLSGPVRSKTQALELARQSAAEAGLNPGELKDIEISFKRNEDIWIFDFEQNGTHECFAIEGNTVGDVRHWTLNETATKKTSAIHFLPVSFTVTLLAVACLFSRRFSAKTTGQKASAPDKKLRSEK